MLPDERVWSLRRILGAVKHWCWLVTCEPPVVLPFWKHLWYMWRPQASHDDGYY